LSCSAPANSDVGARNELADLLACTLALVLDVSLEMWSSFSAGLLPEYHVADCIDEERSFEYLDVGVVVVVDRKHPSARALVVFSGHLVNET